VTLEEYVAFVRAIIKTHKILLGNPKGNRPLGKLRYRQEENIEMELKRTGYEDMGSVHLAQIMLQG
jgi:hypothetical protein